MGSVSRGSPPALSVGFAFPKAPYRREMVSGALEMDRAALKSRFCSCLALQFGAGA